jgi:hypothetical protein
MMEWLAFLTMTIPAILVGKNIASYCAKQCVTKECQHDCKIKYFSRNELVCVDCGYTTHLHDDAKIKHQRG